MHDFRDLVREIQRWQRDLLAQLDARESERVAELDRVVRALDKEVRQRTIDVQIAAQREIVDRWSSAATGYTNLVMLAGYAGLFTAWSASEHLINRSCRRLGLLLGLASAACFVLNETRNMYQTTRLVQRASQALALAETDNDPRHVRDLFRALQRQGTILWRVMFWSALSFGLAAYLLISIGLIVGDGDSSGRSRNSTESRSSNTSANR